MGIIGWQGGEGGIKMGVGSGRVVLRDIAGKDAVYGSPF
jgi:hypothetical protein